MRKLKKMGLKKDSRAGRPTNESSERLEMLLEEISKENDDCYWKGRLKGALFKKCISDMLVKTLLGMTVMPAWSRYLRRNRSAKMIETEKKE